MPEVPEPDARRPDLLLQGEEATNLLFTATLLGNLGAAAVNKYPRGLPNNRMAPFDALPAPMDQYEVGVPLAAAGRCARRLLGYLQAG